MGLKNKSFRECLLSLAVNGSINSQPVEKKHQLLGWKALKLPLNYKEILERSGRVHRECFFVNLDKTLSLLAGGILEVEVHISSRCKGCETLVDSVGSQTGFPVHQAMEKTTVILMLWGSKRKKRYLRSIQDGGQPMK